MHRITKALSSSPPLPSPLPGAGRLDPQLLRRSSGEHERQRHDADLEPPQPHQGTRMTPGLYSTPINPNPWQVDRVMLQEQFELGERVRQWSVAVTVDGSTWLPFLNGTVIGQSWRAAGLSSWLTYFSSLPPFLTCRLQANPAERHRAGDPGRATDNFLCRRPAADPHLCRLCALPLGVTWAGG